MLSNQEPQKVYQFFAEFNLRKMFNPFHSRKPIEVIDEVLCGAALHNLVVQVGQATVEYEGCAVP